MKAARQFGRETVSFFASSNMLVGFHSREDRLDRNIRCVQTVYYGVSKGFW